MTIYYMPACRISQVLHNTKQSPIYALVMPYRYACFGMGFSLLTVLLVFPIFSRFSTPTFNNGGGTF